MPILKQIGQEGGAPSATERTSEANPEDENRSFIFTVCVKSFPLYHFKLAYIVPRIAVKEFFETHF